MLEFILGILHIPNFFILYGGMYSMAFKRVSLDTWLAFNNTDFVGKDIIPHTNENNYKKIAKPERSTSGSAGYDFRVPFDIDIPENTPVVVPTGIIADLSKLFKVNDDTAKKELDKIDEDTDENALYNNSISYSNMPSVYLALYPRSSFGFKYGFRMLNTTGIIDADYAYNESNEGHIMVGFIVSKRLKLEQGTKFCQGIIQPYFTMEDDNTTNTRSGGYGSTGTI